MKRLHLTGLKLTVIGAALTVAGPEVGWGIVFLSGLALMIAGLFVGDKIDNEEN